MMKKSGILGSSPKGLTFIISAPAGTGKTTLVSMLKQEFSNVVEIVSHTTRKPRPDEIDGKDYHFISEEQFKKKVKAKEFLEHATVFGYHYGTDRNQVFEEHRKGNHVILVIDTQGAKKIKKKLNSVSIFISPPSMKELQFRLHSRQSESEEMIQKRLSWAKEEIGCASNYNYHIINDQLDVAYAVLRSILIAEEHRVTKENKTFVSKIFNKE